MVDGLQWPLSEPPRVSAAGRYPLADRAHEITYRHPMTYALHLHEVHGVLGRDGRTEAFRPGEMLVSFPHQSTTYAHVRPQHLWCIHFHLSRGEGAMARIPSTVALGAHRGYIAERMARVSRLHASARTDVLAAARASAILLEILLFLAEIGAASQAGSQRPVDLAVAQVAEWIEAHATQTISIPALAQRFALHQHTLARHFRQRFTRTMQAYQLDCRISQARNLLEHADIPIHALAAQLGFADIQHFSKHFRRRHGMAPQRYRQHAAQLSLPPAR